MCARVLALFVCVAAAAGDEAPTLIPPKKSFLEKSFLAPKAHDVVVSLMTDNVVAGVHGKDDGKEAAEAEEAKAEAEEGGKKDAEAQEDDGKKAAPGSEPVRSPPPAEEEMIRCRNVKNPGACAGHPKVMVTKDKQNVEQLAEGAEEDPVSLITVDGKEAAEEDEAQFLQVERHSLSGVERTVLKAGDGIHFPKNGDTVTMHYTGTLTDGGKKFDSSVDRGQPFVTQIGVGQVIKGWDEGVVKMSLGEKAVLKMTSDYGYGADGAGADIPPNAGLTFEVELLKIN